MSKPTIFQWAIGVMVFGTLVGCVTGDRTPDDQPYTKTLSAAQRDTLRWRMQSLYALDQLIAANFNNANVHPRYAEVTREFRSIVDTYGFPGTEQVGPRMENDSTEGTPYYYIIMLHHYHMGVPLFKDRLREFVDAGQLSEAHFQEFSGMIIEDEALVRRLNAGRKPSPKSPIRSLSLAVYQNQPVYEETYLYPKEQKAVTERSINGLDILLADWNGDSLFTQIGVDYFGFQMPGAPYPRLYLLDTINQFQFDGKWYEYRPLYNRIAVLPEPTQGGQFPRFLTQQLPIALEDGTKLVPNDQPTLVYFWASWCAPCIKKLQQINAAWDEVAAGRVQFLPVALESSPTSVTAIFREQGFQFQPYLGGAATKQDYLVDAFPTAYYFADNQLVRQVAGSEILTYLIP